MLSKRQPIFAKAFFRGIFIGFILFLPFSVFLIFQKNIPHSFARTSGLAENCPYGSTQAQIQKNAGDAWGDNKKINLGQSVILGGFHNHTGLFAGDPANQYSPNIADVDFFMTNPDGTQSQILTPPYPVKYTPSNSGVYQILGKTRKNKENRRDGYFTETACRDQGTLTVVSPASPTPTSSPSPGTGGPVPSPTPTPVPATNIQPECVSLSANPTYGGAILNVTLNGKGRDLDGMIKLMDFNFGDSNSREIPVNGETNKDTLYSLTHSYNNPGIYYASLRVKDNSGQGNEWSTMPESCKVKIEVTGAILGATKPLQKLPQAGASEIYNLIFLTSGFLGFGFKIFSNKLREVM